ncbi:peptidoglycan-binding protein [Rhodococcus sp. SORGH_AS_0303]|uniref:peptidoglycan-binding protein n=1 Tax=Rhodococcus sp. SORGH_AS_0303 TaxID=3041753 RepID=UPI00278A6F9E|nr:peptidoglycan-binding protein [Rhodococcus sp. SORGH_AS_0303]MDQ1202848.1 hypothetical protein [Rhodococcus sp. SORGH_AS_0303]
MSFRKVYGYEWSEAGWRMCNRDECVTVPGPFMDTAPLRRGAPAVILGAFVNELHRVVAPITSPVWGWSLKNDVANSNHLAGVSVDVWAPRLPWGLKRMPADQVAATNGVLQRYPEVFWGRGWSKPDEMHFQMRYREGDPRNDAGVQRILGDGPSAPPAPAPISGRPTIQRGATGQHVRDLQTRLNRDYPRYSNLAVDGDFGPATERVVREFQSRAGITVDGIVGIVTWQKLGLL